MNNLSDAEQVRLIQVVMDRYTMEFKRGAFAGAETAALKLKELARDAGASKVKDNGDRAPSKSRRAS